MQCLNSGRATITHTCTKSAKHLICHLIKCSLIWHACCYTFWHKFLVVGNIALEIAVLATLFHSFERTHSTICLEFTAIENNGFARRFFYTGKHSAQHHRVCSGCQCLNYIARVTDTTIGNQWHSGAFESLSHVVYCRQLWHTYTGNDACGANRTRTNTYLYTIGTIFHQVFGCFAGSYVTHHYIHLRECGFHTAKHFHYTLGVSVSCIYHQCIHACLYKSTCTLHRILGNAYSGCHAQASKCILGCIWLILGFCYVFICYKAHQLAVLVDNRQFFNLMILKYVGCLFKIGRLAGDYQIIFGHHIINNLGQITFKAQVSIGNDAHQISFIIHHRYATYFIFVHHIQRILHC